MCGFVFLCDNLYWKKIVERNCQGIKGNTQFYNRVDVSKLPSQWLYHVRFYPRCIRVPLAHNCGLFIIVPVFEKYLCYSKQLRCSQNETLPLFLAPSWSASFDVPMETTHGAPLDSVGSDVWSTEEPVPTKETGWASFSEFASSLR